MILSGKTILITGGGNGIGRELAELFITEKATVYSFDDSYPQPLVGLSCIEVDVTNDEQIANSLQHIHSPIDVLISDSDLVKEVCKDKLSPDAMVLSPATAVEEMMERIRKGK